MKLPRYPVARSVTSELQRGQAALITPAEAARAEIAKFGAISTVADAVGKVALVEAEARAEEEFTDAVFDYESRTQEYDVEVESKGFELDENDNIIVDDQQMVKDELTARKKISDEVRENMTSSMGKRQFDKYMVQSNLRRNTEYTQRAVERRIKALGAQAVHKVENLMLEGKFEAAYERGKEALKNGVINQAKFDSMRLSINQERTRRYVGDTIEHGTHKDLTDAVDALDEGTLPGGNQLGIGADENYMLRARLSKRISELDDEAYTAVEKAREDQYLKLLPTVVNGKMDVAELNTYRDVLDKDRFDKLTGYAVTASRRPPESDSDTLEHYERRIMELRIGKGYDPAYSGFMETVDDVIDAMSLDPGLAINDVNRMVTDLEGYVNGIRNNPDLEDILNVEMVKILGRKVDQMMVMFEGRDQYNEVVASRLERDFKRAMLEVWTGDRNAIFNGEKWMKENVTAYHIEVQTKVMNDYGINEAPTLPNGKVDFDKLAKQMQDFQVKKQEGNDTGQGMSESEAKQQAEYDFNTLRRLIGAG